MDCRLRDGLTMEKDMRTLFIVLSCLALTITACDKKSAEGDKSKTAEQTTQTATSSSTATTTATGTPTATSKTTTTSANSGKQASASKEEKPYPGCIYNEDGSKEGACPSEAAANHGQLGGKNAKAAAAEGSTLPPGHYGMKFLPVDTTSGPLAAAIKTAEANKEKVQRFTGTIGEVCTKKGCWFVLQDGTQQARVMMRGVLENDTKYFRIPIKSSGKKALIEGKLITKVFSEANVKHIEYDAGRDPEKVSGSRKEFVIQARAVKIDG